MPFGKTLLLISLFLLFSVTSLQAQPDAQAAFSRGVEYLKNQQYSKAKQKFNEAIISGEVPAGVKMAYVYKGMAERELQDYEAAILSFSEAISIDSLDAASFTDRGLTYSAADSTAKAVEDFKHVLTLDSIGRQAKAACYYLGRLYLNAWQVEEAVVYLDKLLQLAPTDAEGYFYRALAQERLGNVVAALADYDKAIYFNSDYMEAYANRGVVKLNMLPVKDKLGKKCVKEPCKDLLKAWSMGDDKIGDLVNTYCKKCKN